MHWGVFQFLSVIYVKPFRLERLNDYSLMSAILNPSYRLIPLPSSLRTLRYPVHSLAKLVRTELLKNLKTRIGSKLTAGEAKEVVRDIYRELGIGRSPKGSDLQDFLKVRKTTSRKKGSTPVTCYVVEGKK